MRFYPFERFPAWGVARTTTDGSEAVPGTGSTDPKARLIDAPKVEATVKSVAARGFLAKLLMLGLPLDLVLTDEATGAVEKTGMTTAGAEWVMARDTSVNVRITNELRAKLEKLAAEDERTLSAYVEKVLKEHVAERDKPKRK